jgi:glycosyltransferase involved in cell wall biosynthesis
LVEAFGLLHKRHPDARLLIVGDGPERECLMADLGARGLLHATQLTGAVAPDQVPGLLASMDVAVAPYPEISPFYFSPLKVYEYMAAGLAVVASRVGQLENLIQDGENGLLTTPGDLDSLTEALGRLLANRSLREHLGAGARATICKGHTWDSVVDRIFRIIEPIQETRLLARS